jgi:hypothetical protein
MKVKKGSKLCNVEDLYGVKHKQAKVINIYENTLSASDLKTGENFIIHKYDLGLIEKPRYGKFNLDYCKRVGKPSTFDKVRHFVSGNRA